MFNIIKQHGCDSLTEFNLAQSTLPEVISISPQFGHQGKCVKMVTTTTNSDCSIRDSFTALEAVRTIRFYHRLADENLTANYTIAHGWFELAGNAYGGDLFNITLNKR